MYGLVVFVFCVLVSTSESFRLDYWPEDDLEDVLRGPRPYDHAVLSQQWPQSSYWQLNNRWHEVNAECCPCFMPDSKLNWTMHGLWPSNFHGPHPSFCDRDLKYSPKGLDRARLAQEWPTLESTKTNDIFWKHEWDKHGTCARELPQMGSVPGFFHGSLDVLRRFNMGWILAEAGITPGRGKAYLYREYVGAVEKVLGVRGSLLCAVNRATNEQYVGEIYICLDKSLRPIDCVGETSRCRKTDKILYPEMLSSCRQ